MMAFAVGQWLWHLSALHRFDELVDKIDDHCKIRVMEAKTRHPGLRWCPKPMYPSTEGSSRWACFPVVWLADGLLDEPDPMSFSLGLVPWVQTPNTFMYSH
jgi:hypothetical protein